MYDYYNEFDLIDSKLDSIDNKLSLVLSSGESYQESSLLYQQGIYNTCHQVLIFAGCLSLIVFVYVLTSYLPKRKGVLKK